MGHFTNSRTRMKFLIFLSLFLLINGRPQRTPQGLGPPVKPPLRPASASRPGLVYRARENIPFFDSVLIQETRDRRQPHETGEEHVHSDDQNTHGSNAELDFHFDEMPMKSFVQLGPNEVEDKQPLSQ